MPNPSGKNQYTPGRSFGTAKVAERLAAKGGKPSSVAPPKKSTGTSYLNRASPTARVEARLRVRQK